EVRQPTSVGVGDDVLDELRGECADDQDRYAADKRRNEPGEVVQQPRQRRDLQDTRRGQERQEVDIVFDERADNTADAAGRSCDPFEWRVVEVASEVEPADDIR